MTQTGRGLQNPHMHLVIVGAGIAGLSAALYARLYGFETTIYEELAPGGRCLETVHAKYFPGLPADEKAVTLAERLESQVLDSGAVLRNERVLQVSSREPASADGPVTIRTESDETFADACIIAVGDERKPAGIPGEEEFAGRGLSYCATCDGPLFRGRDVCVIGGGDSACDEALFLSEICSTVHLLCRSEELTALPALRTELSGRDNIRQYFGAQVRGLEGTITDMGFRVLQSVRFRWGGTETSLAVAAAFVFVGRRGLAASIAPELDADADGRLHTDRHMRTSGTMIYAVGSARSNPIPQFVVAAADGVVAVKDLYDRMYEDT